MTIWFSFSKFDNFSVFSFMPKVSNLMTPQNNSHKIKLITAAAIHFIAGSKCFNVKRFGWASLSGVLSIVGTMTAQTYMWSL